MSAERFPTHHRPNLSRLDPFKGQIAAMRRQHWPYRKIIEWLAGEGITIAYEPLRRFCIRRGIASGERSKQQPKTRVAERPIISPPSSATATAKPPKKIFRYDDSKPIQTRKNHVE